MASRLLTIAQDYFAASHIDEDSLLMFQTCLGGQRGGKATAFADALQSATDEPQPDGDEDAPVGEDAPDAPDGEDAPGAPDGEDTPDDAPDGDDAPDESTEAVETVSETLAEDADEQDDDQAKACQGTLVNDDDGCKDDLGDECKGSYQCKEDECRQCEIHGSGAHCKPSENTCVAPPLPPEAVVPAGSEGDSESDQAADASNPTSKEENA